MIDYISGVLNFKSTEGVIVEAGGIGYKIAVPISTFSKLPGEGSGVKIYIVEAVAGMYGGVISLYGFLTREERDMYLLIKEEVPSTGAKKALEYTDKISKSFADFKTAISAKDAGMLNSVFGFTKKTADKLIAALKEKIITVNVIGQEKWAGISGDNSNRIVADAISALVSLGYKEFKAREAVNNAYGDDKDIAVEDLIKKALKFIG